MENNTRSLTQSVQVSDIVCALRQYGVTQRMVARVCGVHERTIFNWKRTCGIRRDAERRLRDLRDIVLLLEKTLKPRGVGQWLRANNQLLNGRAPIVLLSLDGVEKVKEAASAYVEGSYY